MLTTMVLFFFPFTETNTWLEHLSESSPGFWHKRIHRAEEEEELSNYNSLLLYSKTLFLCHNSTATKAHTNFPYASNLGVVNKLDMIRNCLADHL